MKRWENRSGLLSECEQMENTEIWVELQDIRDLRWFLKEGNMWSEYLQILKMKRFSV